MSRSLRAPALAIWMAMVAVSAAASRDAHATLRLWPGAAPCATTLQACLSAAATNDTVEVQTNTVVDEDLAIDKPMILSAAPGYRLTLASGRSISAGYDPGAGVAWGLTFDGISLLQGNIHVFAGSGDANVTLQRLDINAPAAGSFFSSALGITNAGAGHLVYTIERNRVQVDGTTGLDAIQIDSSRGGSFDGSIHDNRIASPSSPDSVVYGITLSGSATSHATIYANQVTGNMQRGVSATATAGQFTLVVADNLLRSTAAAGSSGISLSFGSGPTLVASVFNNTLGGFDTGISFYGSITGRISGNLLASNSLAISQAGGAAAAEDHDLFFANGGGVPALGIGSMIADPKFARGLDDMRLTAASPAIDGADSAALSTLLANASIPQIDADGLRRFKGASSTADIGAFEYGDGALIEFATAANAGVIDNALLNNNGAGLPQLTQDHTPDTYLAAYDPGLTALQYAANRFGVVDEDGTAPANGSAFNVFVPGAGNGVLLHATSAGNVSSSPALTKINDAYLNGHGDRIVLATNRATPDFNHPFGVTYGFFLSTFWYIHQLDASVGTSFPAGLNFHIYAQDASLNAFVWNAPFSGPSTPIDHVLLNGEPCGRLYVTNGISDPHPIAVTYAAQRWTIVNLDGASMPADAEFYVVVDEAATQFCRYDHLYHDGFSGG